MAGPDRVVLGATEVLAYGAGFRNLRPADGVTRDGVLVTAVEGGSIAAMQQLRAGDVVTAVGAVAVGDIGALAAAMTAATGGLNLTVLRDGRTVTIALAG